MGQLDIKRLTSAAAIAPLCLMMLWPLVARAESPAPVKVAPSPAPRKAAPAPARKAPPSDADRFWRPGHQISIELGAGGDAGDLSGPNYYGGGRNTYVTGLSAGVALQYSHRFNPYISFGPRLFYYAIDEDIEGAGSNSDSSAFATGVDFMVTGHMWFSRFDPYVGFSVGYAMWNVPVNDGGGRHNYRLHGVTLSLALGLDIYVTRFLSLGPVFRYHFPFWIQYCATGIGDHCDSVEDLTAVNAFNDSLPDLVFVGAHATFHIQ